MAKETMSPKERWLAVIERKKPDRVPMDIWATPEALRKLMNHMGCPDMESLCHRLHIDKPVMVSPRYAGPPRPEDEDVFGCRYRNIDYGTGVYRECVFNVLAEYDSVEEIEAHYSWPSPDWYDYAGLSEQISGKEHRPVRGGGSEPFLKYKHLRGQEQAFMDLVLNPEIVHYCLDKMFDLCFEDTSRIYETIPGKVNLSYVAEDMGSQEGLLFAPELIRAFLIPRMKRMIDLAHQAGAYVIYHSDGSIRKILPDMIEAGIDILNPIQWRCADMDRQKLKDDFGDRVIFYGGVDNQYTLAFGSVEEVEKEVIEDLSILGGGGGYILAPCHNIQAVSPPENIAAMYETGHRRGWL